MKRLAVTNALPGQAILRLDSGPDIVGIRENPIEVDRIRSHFLRMRSDLKVGIRQLLDRMQSELFESDRILLPLFDLD